ncbi:deoxycytidylate deaminase [Lactococcus nasutitermitis]|uniref:Deoxycytidylate deaminase n=1 Tax=Lactococcus nasutitermitis TaxID=1652957 RepID=A0ABV9JDF4_9LACT|nr:dCMP deaminase family protein [Lactococcus nasutitermitis]
MSEKIKRPSKDEYFKEIVQVVAKRSTCNHAQVGALLVSPSGQLLSTGYNGSVSGMPHCTDVGCLEDKDGHCIATVHAEQNAIAQAAKHGVSPEGAILYTTLFPCIACLKLVLASGVKEIKYIDEYHAKDDYEESLIKTLGISCEKI